MAGTNPMPELHKKRHKSPIAFIYMDFMAGALELWP